MQLDTYQQAWQTHASQTRVTVDADVLLKQVQRSQRAFQAVIFIVDFREVVTALILLPVWIYMGVVTASPWTWYLTVPVLVWIAGFMLVYRKRHKPHLVEPGEPLLDCVKNSLTEVEDQCWLLRNIFWWYLLPPSISITVFFVHVGWLSRHGGWLPAAGLVIANVGILAAVFAAIYFLNQRVVRLQLEPRRRELLTLLASLQDEAAGENADDRVELPALPFAGDSRRTSSTSPPSLAVNILAFLIGITLLMVMLIVMVNLDPYHLTGEGYPHRSPFAAVRWHAEQPEVKLGDEWFMLVSLDGIPASEILAFSRRTYGDKWRKRFEEDLVELLTQMGHPPRDKVNLVVQSLNSSKTRTLQDVPMTYANRRAIRAAAQTHDNSMP